MAEKTPNKSLQRTFDPPPIFAAAKTGGALNADELRRWAEDVLFSYCIAIIIFS